MTRVIHLLALTVFALAAVIGVIVLWTLESPITIRVSHAFAGEVSSLTPSQQQITAALTAFGAQEQHVNVMEADASSTIAQDYGQYVIPSLLAQWEAAPQSAPGRVVASPWPDHIIINSIVPTQSGFTANATLVLMSPQAEARDTFDSEDPLVVTFVVYNHQWMLSGYADESGSGS